MFVRMFPENHGGIWTYRKKNLWILTLKDVDSCVKRRSELTESDSDDMRYHRWCLPGTMFTMFRLSFERWLMIGVMLLNDDRDVGGSVDKQWCLYFVHPSGLMAGCWVQSGFDHF